MPASLARAAAFDILLRVEQEGAFASDLLHTRCANLSAADRALATEVVMGTLRWRALLDSRVSKVSSQRVEKLDAEVLTSLRIGAYQIGWLDRVPVRAAIYESVELVKRARKRSAAPFANAVLRKLAEAAGDESPPSELIQSAATAQALASVASHPEWLVQHWVTQFGLEVTRQICRYNQSPPETSIRLRAASAAEQLQHDRVELAPGTLLSDARRVRSGDVVRTKAFAEGNVAIQDEASQLVAALVGRGAKVLDCCAAPGGKTLAIADRNPLSAIVAVEVHPHRARALQQRVALQNVQVLTADICDLPVEELFDRVLVDAPCSGTGTLARNPEIKWRLRPEDLADLSSRQLAILQSAMNHVAPGGRVVYSTCSLEADENESVIDETLRGSDSFRLLNAATDLDRLRVDGRLAATDVSSLVQGDFVRTIPGIHACDGFFVAILERR